jgi:hypothetical protein
VGYQTINNQAANVVNADYIKQAVHQAFYPPPTHKATAKKPAAKGKPAVTLPPSAITVDVFNGGAPAGMAGQVSRALTSAGYKAGKVRNIAAQSSTKVLYGTGAAGNARRIAGYYTGVTASPSSSVAAGHVEVLLGSNATSVPAGISSSAGAAAGASGSASSPAPSPSSTTPSASQSNGQSGGAVTVKANAPYGIPCVD